MQYMRSNSFIQSKQTIIDAIAAFNADDHPEANIPRQAELDQYEKIRGTAPWGANRIQNPYSARCANFSKAYQTHFTAVKIPFFQVKTPAHLYILIPVNEHGRIDILIFDPTAEQIYSGMNKPYFLGTEQELRDFHTQKKARGEFHLLNNRIDFEGIYYNRLRVAANNGFHFAVSVPESAERIFKMRPTEIAVLEGKVDLEARLKELESSGNYWSLSPKDVAHQSQTPIPPTCGSNTHSHTRIDHKKWQEGIEPQSSGFSDKSK